MTTTKKPRRRTLPNIWQAIDKGDMPEFQRHLKIEVEKGTLSTPFNNSVGLTILHFAAINKNFNMFTALIDAGADPYVRNGDGEDVLTYARRANRFSEKHAAYIAQHEAAKLAKHIQPATATPTASRPANRL